MSRAPDDLPQACRRAQMIGAALVLAVIIYAIVVESLVRGTRTFRGFAPDAQVGILRLMLVASTVGNLIVSRVLRRKLADAAARSTGASTVGQQLLLQTVLELALAEAIAVYGLVLFLVGGNPMDFYGFAAVSLMVLTVQFPRLSVWEERARERRPSA